MADKEIEIPVLVKTKPAPDGSVNGVAGFASHFGKIFQSVKTNPYVLAAIALVVSAKKSIDAWQVQERSVNSLNQAMINQGFYSKKLSEHYQQMAMDVQKSTAFADEEVIFAISSMQPYIKDKEVTREMIMRVADFATAKQMPLAKAAELIGKSIETDVNALARYGIVLSENLTKNEKLAAIMLGIKGNWDGWAETHVKGLGAVDQMKNALSTLLELVGKMIAPFVSGLAKDVSDFCNGLAKNTEFLSGISTAMLGIETSTLILKTVLFSTLDHIIVLITSRFKAMTSLMRGSLEGAANIYNEGEKKIGEIAKKAQVDLNAGLTRIIQNDFESREKARQEKLEKEAAKGKNRFFIASEKVSANDFDVKQKKERALVEQVVFDRLREDQHLRVLNKRIANASSITEKKKIELEKVKYIKERINEAEKAHSEKSLLLDIARQQAELNQVKKVVDIFSGMKDSKVAPLILIGKAAAIASIIINAGLAVLNARIAFAEIPPPVGPALGQAFAAFTQLYAKEQVKNIIDSDVDNPGKIGEIPFSLGNIIRMIGADLADQAAIVSKMWDLTSEGAAKISDAIKAAADELGALGTALSFSFTSVLDVSSMIAGAVSEIYSKVSEAISAITEAVAEVVNAVVSAIGDAIGDIADALFGWLFAEGGVVTHSLSGSPVVTPLHKSGIRFGEEINVKIRGGLIPSDRGAEKLAALILSKTRG